MNNVKKSSRISRKALLLRDTLIDIAGLKKPGDAKFLKDRIVRLLEDPELGEVLKKTKEDK